MRILHIDTERGWRGGERQVLWLSQGLSRRGHRSLLAARDGQPLAERARSAGASVIACAPVFEVDPFSAWSLRRVIEREQVQIVHAHTGHAVGLGALAAGRNAARLVVTRRVDFPLRRNAITRWKYRRADAIIAISHAVALVLRAGGIEPERISVVRDGTDVSRAIAPLSAELLAALGVPHGAPLAVQVAQLVAHKDPVNFVRAINEARRSVPNLHGLIAGDGPLRDEVEREIHTLGLAGAVRLLGYRADADALLASATVCVLSSREEGMGSVLLDALLLGKPIAATRAGGIPEVIEDGRTGLLAPVGDPVALGRAIARLVSDEELAKATGRAARARVHDFSVERMTEETEAVYARVLERAPMPAPA